MTNETALLALLESREAEANAKAEWIAEWTAANRPLLLAGMLETDPATMLGGDDAQFKQFIQQVVDAGLADLAQAAWSNHLAELQTAMSEEQFEQYQHRSAA